MNEVNISVIMPVYNAEKYLREALQSLLKQTFRNFEIICVDDGSTDGSLNILREFQRSDSRIRILVNDGRCGAAASRNKGMCASEGKYITFLDGDDLFDEEMLALAYETIERLNVDIVMYEYIHIPSEHIHEKRNVLRSDWFVERYCRRPFSICEYDPIEFINWTGSPCNKLYRKEFIRSKKLEFQTLSSCNDVYFVNMALMLARKIIMLEDRRVMVYAREHHEPTRISSDRDPMCSYLAMVKIGEELTARGLFQDLFQYYYFRCFYMLRGGLVNARKEETAKRFYQFLKEEGIDNLAALCEDCYQKVERYVHNLLEDYKRVDFDIKWYQYENMIGFYLDRNSEHVISLLQSFENQGKKSALWGAGVKGRVFLSFLERHGLHIAAVADKNECKQGKAVNGYIVRKPEEILINVQVVIVCTFAVWQDVSEELSGTGIEVVNLEKYCIEV